MSQARVRIAHLTSSLVLLGRTTGTSFTLLAIGTCSSLRTCSSQGGTPSFITSSSTLFADVLFVFISYKHMKTSYEKTLSELKSMEQHKGNEESEISIFI